MTFWKITETKMNCLITQEEIEILGYSMDELMQNHERTKEFLNLLLAKGCEVLKMQMSGDVTSFYGALLPDRSLLLSIACEGEAQRVSQPQSAKNELVGEDTEEVLSYQIVFPELDHMIQFCGAFGGGKTAESRLYENDRLYYLMMDFNNTEEGRDAARSIISAEEFGGLVEQNAISELFLKEHEKCLIQECAVEKLCEMDS
ncbi:MAG: adaptor protein MecA [Bariatricus sp.]